MLTVKRLSWFGHINRMPEISVVREMLGRPKSRWADDVRSDLRKMKLVKWTEQVQDRLKRKAIVEKAKNVPEF
jgi:hypothetical protein